MNPILAVKLGCIAFGIGMAFSIGYHLGGLASKTALEADHAAMAEAATRALLAQRSQQDAETARLNKVVSDYENTPIDPIVPGIARRVFIYASRPDCPVPKANPVAGGTQAPAAIALGPSEVERAFGEYVAACSADAAQMIPMVELAP